MTEADVMATTFFHTCTIRRQTLVQDGAITRPGEMTVVYENIPCAVSTGGGSQRNQTDEYVPVEYTDTLYTRPDVTVEPGDEITVQIYNETDVFLSGAGRRYPSHRQTPIMRKGRA